MARAAAGALVDGSAVAASPRIDGAARRTGRVLAIDALRGVTIVGMVTVNAPGDSPTGWAQLQHATWNGCRLADLVFPAFLFVMGTAMAVSLPRHREHGRAALTARLVRRSVLLIAIGLALNALAPLTSGALRYPGVLQRTGLCYLVASLIVVAVPIPAQVAAGVGLLVGYGWMLERMPVPGIGAGVVTPAGNVGGWIDRSLFGQAHLYRHLPYDPEGLLTTTGAVVTVLLGYWAGGVLLRGRTDATHFGSVAASPIGVFASGAGLIGVGWLARSIVPLNKRLWTPSFALWTAGWLLLVLAVVWWMLEVRRWHSLGEPWASLGANAILLYVGTELSDHWLSTWKVGAGERTVHAWIYDTALRGRLPGVWPSLVWSLVFVGLWGAIAVACTRRGWLVRV